VDGTKNSLKAIGELPPTYLGGWSAATKTLNILVNLANSSHTDPYDLGIGIVVWIFDTNDELSQSFVFPNLLTTQTNGTTAQGCVVKISDGIALSWNGNCIRHCTLIHTKNGMPVTDSVEGENGHCSGNIYGFHFVNSMCNLASYPSMRVQQYCHQLSFDLNSFTNLNTNNNDNTQNYTKKLQMQHTNIRAKR